MRYSQGLNHHTYIKEFQPNLWRNNDEIQLLALTFIHDSMESGDSFILILGCDFD